MAKFHLDRLRRKYNWTGGRYADLMKRIIANENQNIGNAVGRMKSEDFRKAAGKIRRTGQRVVLPDMGEVLPKRSVYTRKAAEQGLRLTDDLRDRMTKSLRKTMEEHQEAGKPSFVKPRGAAAGRVPQELVEKFKGRLEETFDGYKKKDPRYGTPPNINAIATTEARSTINTIKAQYAERFKRENPHLGLAKKWVHNKSLSEEPRPHHMAADGTTVEYGQPFRLQNGAVLMHPHDPQADASEVINCHCDWDIIVVSRGRRG